MQKSTGFPKSGPSHDGDKVLRPLKQTVYLSSDDEEDLACDLNNLTSQLKDMKFNNKKRTRTSEDMDLGDDEDSDKDKLYPSRLTTVGPMPSPAKKLFKPDTKAKPKLGSAGRRKRRAGQHS